MDKRYYPFLESVTDGQGREIYFNGGTGRGRATFGGGPFSGPLSYRSKKLGPDRSLQILRTAEDEEQCVSDSEGEQEETTSDS